MTSPARLDITLQANERYDRVYYAKLRDGTLYGLDGFTALFTVYDGDQALASSADATPEITLTQYADAVDKGRIDLLIGQDFTGSLLVPFNGPPDYWYRFDLVDNSVPTNIIPMFVGTVTMQRRYGL